MCVVSYFWLVYQLMSFSYVEFGPPSLHLLPEARVLANHKSRVEKLGS